MFSSLRAENVCEHCLMKSEQQAFLFIRNAWRATTWLVLIGGVLLTLLFSFSGREDSAFEMIILLVGAVIAITIAGAASAAQGVRSLYIFCDAEGRVHGESAYPVSTLPGNVRDASTLAHGPVLRITQNPFAACRFVTPTGRRALPDRVWIDRIRLDRKDASFACAMHGSRFTRLSFRTLQQLMRGHTSSTENLLHDAFEHKQCWSTIEGLRTERDALVLERDALRADADARKPEYEELRATCEMSVQNCETLGMEVIETLARIRHFHPRCPREIPTRLERALDAVFLPAKIVALIYDLASTAHPYIGTLRETPYYRAHMASLPPSPDPQTAVPAHAEPPHASA